MGTVKKKKSNRITIKRSKDEIMRISIKHMSPDEKSFLAQKKKGLVGWGTTESGYTSSLVPLQWGPRSSYWRQFHPQMSALGNALERLQKPESTAESWWLLSLGWGAFFCVVVNFERVINTSFIKILDQTLLAFTLYTFNDPYGLTLVTTNRT